MEKPLLLGAVAYDAKVVPIWDGFADWFAVRGLPFDYVLFTNYERQVQALLAGTIDVAWNSPLAWLQTERAAQWLGLRPRAVAMRDTDCDLCSVVVVAAHSPYANLADLRGHTVAVGAWDSPQATLLPLAMLAEHGLQPGREVQVVAFDVLAGKHGDHIGGERDAARALAAGQVDAACMLDANLLLFAKEGTLPAGSVRILARTPAYDHCNFSVLGQSPQIDALVQLLLSMSYDDPTVRPLLDLEGLKRWLPGRTSGYAPLQAALTRFGSVATLRQACGS